MLKHWLKRHRKEGMELEDVRYTFEAMRFFRSPLERMVCEALEIKRALENPKVELMNSKVEFSRTVLPNIEGRKVTKEEEGEEKALEEEIENLKKSLTSQEEVNNNLQKYIDSVILNIMEKHPELLEVTQRK